MLIVYFCNLGALAFLFLLFQFGSRGYKQDRLTSAKVKVP